MAKVITYDAGNEVIYFDGGTAVDPITPQDIYDADVAGGWGVSSKHDCGSGDQTLFVFDASLDGGQNSATFFKMVKTILFCRVWRTSSITDLFFDRSVAADGSTRNEDHIAYTIYRGTGTIGDSCLMFGMYNRLDIDGNVLRSMLLANTSYIYSNDPNTNFQDVLMPIGTLDFYTTSPLAADNMNLFGPMAESNTSVFESPRVRDRLRTYNGILDLRNPIVDDWGALFIGCAFVTDEIWLKFDFARPILDGSGDPIEGATVVITDSTAAEVANYDTDADGLPATRVLLLSKTWIGTDETETDYSPFTVTVSKAGYQTYTAVVTIDNPQEDAIALLDLSEMPAVGDVEESVSYAEGQLVGTLALPPVGRVIEGNDFGEDGTEFVSTYHETAVAEVLDGVLFGEDGTEFEGSLALVEYLAPENVRVGIDRGDGEPGVFVGTPHYIKATVPAPPTATVPDAPIARVP